MAEQLASGCWQRIKEEGDVGRSKMMETETLQGDSIKIMLTVDLLWQVFKAVNYEIPKYFKYCIWPYRTKSHFTSFIIWCCIWSQVLSFKCSAVPHQSENPPDQWGQHMQFQRNLSFWARIYATMIFTSHITNRFYGSRMVRCHERLEVESR